MSKNDDMVADVIGELPPSDTPIILDQLARDDIIAYILDDPIYCEDQTPLEMRTGVEHPRRLSDAAQAVVNKLLQDEEVVEFVRAALAALK